jgi:hypothetical protein
LGGWQGGNSVVTGRTFGNTTTGGSYRYNGASYGGIGGLSGENGTVNAAYGNIQSPNEVGSGGGGYYYSGYPGGNGGGLVKITTGVLNLSGNILADGGSTASPSGSGSGGGIQLNVGTLSGSGKIYARGGSVTYGSTHYGSGGGGRIAIYYDTNSLPTANIIASGGKTYDGSVTARNGGAGTIYLKDNARQYADLYVNNNGISSAANSTPLKSFGRGVISAKTESSLTKTAAGWIPSLYKGYLLNPNVNQSLLFTVTDNSADTLFVDITSGVTLTYLANPGDTFSGVFELDNVYVSGKANLYCPEELLVHTLLSIDGSTVTATDRRGGQTELLNGGVLK